MGKSKAKKRAHRATIDPLANGSKSDAVGRRRKKARRDAEQNEHEQSRRSSNLSRESGEVSSHPPSVASPASDDSQDEHENMYGNIIYPARSGNHEEVVRMNGASVAGKVTFIRDITEAEKDLQYRYYHISEPDDQVRCLCCGQQGHMEEFCPEKQCEHCRGQHFAMHCPSHTKCRRCRQRGHRDTSCPNRVIEGGGTGDPCDVCSKVDHVEEECAKLWSTFDADSLPSHAFQKTPASRMVMACYNCGATSSYAEGGHLGDECPRLPAWMRRKLNNVTTWTAGNARKFVQDEGSEDGSVGDRGSVGQDYGAHAYQLSAFDDMRD